ncbi:MAG: hypothetical protein WBD36_00630 [Bacteroidota bacterium]
MNIIKTLLLMAFLWSPCSAAGDSLLVANLRGKLRYKFVLDFLRETRPEKQFFDSRRLNLYSSDSARFQKIETEDKYAVEEFMYYLDYRLYTIESLDRRNHYYLLGLFYPSLAKVFLFEEDLDGNKLVDTLNVKAIGAWLAIDSLNHHSTLNLETIEYGSGHYAEHRTIVGITGGRFKTVFSYKPVECNANMGQEKGILLRTTNLIRFVDFDNDSLEDIVMEKEVDLVQGEMTMGDYADEIRKRQVLKKLSVSKTRYLWNEVSLSFDEVK